MPSVVRSTFVLGAFALAAVSGLTACGDKVTVHETPVDSSVQSVTVSPPGPVQMKINDKVTFTASVQGGPGLTNHSVTWKSSAPTIASVDNNGVVTALTGGTASIIATSVANTGISGAGVVQVGANVPATVTISSINQGGVPATLSNVAGQLDVTLNVDPGSQTISEVDLIMNNGTADTVVATQSLSSGNVVPAALDSLAEGAASPVTLSFNTAAFNATTGAISFKNGAYTLKAKAITSTGTQVASSSTALTLNNTDGVIVTTANSGASANDANGLPWKSGNITVAALPVLYSGRTPATVTITLPGANSASITGPASSTGTTSVTWSASSSTSPSVKGLTLFDGFNSNNFQIPVHPSVLIVDSNGNDLNLDQLNPTGQSDVRIDNQAPNISPAGSVVYTSGTQNTANNWAGANFTFTKAITLSSAVKADNDGVDAVTFTTQWSPTGAGTWTTFSDVKTLSETSNSTGLDLRVVVCDKLNNCVNSVVLTQFGVDLTAPTAQTLSGPKANEIVGIGGTLTGGGSISVGASDPQGANGAQGSGFGTLPVLATETQLAPSGATGQTLNCVIGTAATPAGTGCSAAAAEALTFTGGTASPGQYALSYTVTDQAGNQSAATTANYYLDQTAAPSMSGGISIPASITNGAVFTASGTDDMDFASVNGVLSYPGAALQIAGTSSAAGVAFDNTLTRSSTATVTLSNFFRSLGGFDATGAINVAQAKPTQISIRGVDAANNLSAGDIGLFPANNIAGNVDLTGTTSGFILASDQASLCNASGNCAVATAPRSANLTATVNATGPTANSPFSQVCFYVTNPPGGAEGGQADAVSKGAAGELFLISCTSVQTTQPGGPNGKVIVSSVSFDPDVKYGTAASLSIVAIGVTANGDAMMAAAGVTIATTP